MIQQINIRLRSTCSGGMGDDPLDMASRTGRSCGTVGMDTGMMDLVWCPISGMIKRFAINCSLLKSH